MSSEIVFSIKKFTNVVYQSHAIDSNALNLNKREDHCIFIQLPSAGMVVEPRLTECDAWSEDVQKDWEVRYEKVLLENKLLEIKRQRHEARLQIDPPDLDYPDCCDICSFVAKLQPENVRPDGPEE